MLKATVVAGYPSVVLGQEDKQNPIILEWMWGFLFVRGSGPVRQHDAIVLIIATITPLPRRIR